MPSRKFFIHLRFIKTVLKHKYLKIRTTHGAKYTFRMFSYEERPFNRKKKVSSLIFPKILVKNAGMYKITPQN